MTRIKTTRFFDRQLDRVSEPIRAKVRLWVRLVETLGISQVRRRPGFHDEPLKGTRSGQRSVRMNRSYRLIYVETAGHLELLLLEISKHDY